MTTSLLKTRIAMGTLIAITGTAIFSFSQLDPSAPVATRLLRESAIWLLAGFILIYALRIEKLPAATIGLQKFTWKGTALPGLAAGIALTAIAAAVIYIAKTHFGLKTDNHLTATIAGTPVWMIVLLSLRAGFTEEIIYRGYMLDRLGRLGGSHWFGVIGSIALFTIMHFGGWQATQLILVALAGTLFTALYLWKRNIMVCIIAHATLDLLAGLAVLGSRSA